MNSLYISQTEDSESDTSILQNLHFLLGGAAPTLRWGRKGGTPAQSWLGIVRATGPEPFRHYSRPNTHLHCMPQCKVTPAGFANCSIYQIPRGEWQSSGHNQDSSGGSVVLKNAYTTIYIFNSLSANCPVSKLTHFMSQFSLAVSKQAANFILPKMHHRRIHI